MIINRCSIIVAAAVLLLLAVGAFAADDLPASARIDPDALTYTFFPVTLLQAFVGISDDQAGEDQRH